MKETPTQQRIRLDAGALNVFVQRNNVGACYDDKGRLIRYGLMNDTAEINREYKSSDLVGILPIVIEPWMVGYTFGRYLAIECKASDWHLTPGDARGQAQQRYIELVQRYGGIAGFATNTDDFRRIIGR